MSQRQLEKFDRILRRYRCEPNKPYDEIHNIFIGEFHQLLHFGRGTSGALYSSYANEYIDTSDICYACPVNDERNSIATNIFRDFVEKTNPMTGNDDCISKIPKNAVIIRSAIFDRNSEQCNRPFETKVYNRCGDKIVKYATSKKLIQHCSSILEFLL